MMENEPLIELSAIHVSDPERKTLTHGDSEFLCLHSERDLQTSFGNVHVSVQGKEGKPAIVTFHDIGQNHTSAFLGFFNFVEVRPLLDHFCIYHIDAPGQDSSKSTLPEQYVYPTMEELATKVVHEVVEHLGIKTFIGFGIGAGSNVLCRYGLLYPDKVDALILVNLTTSKAGWMEWGYEKVCVRQLQSKGMTTFVEDYLLWHHFGEKTKIENMDLAVAYKESLRTMLNPATLGPFINSYINRTNIDMHRPEGTAPNPNRKTLQCHTLLLTGSSAPHQNDVAEANGKMNPTITDYMKVSDCGGMPLEEQPHKVAQAIILFLQGNGYVSRLRTGSSTSYGKIRAGSSNASSTATIPSSTGSSEASLDQREPQVC